MPAWPAVARRVRQVMAQPPVLVYWVKLVLGRGLLTTGIALRSPALVAAAWRCYLNRSALHHPADRTARIAHDRHAQRTLVVLDRSGGNEDIETAFAGTTARYHIRFLNRDAVKAVCAAFLPATAVDDDQYVSQDRSVEDGKRHYREFLTRTLRWYQRWCGAVAFVQFNLYYYAEVELASACTDLGIPFLTAQKECLRPAQAWCDMDTQLREARGAYTGTAIAVYNAACAEAFVGAGIVAPERIEVVGCARMDESHRLRQARASAARTVVYFLIDPNASAPLYQREDGRWVRGFKTPGGRLVTWGPLIERTNRAVLQFAVTHPDVRVICKGKSGFSDGQLAAFGGQLPPNVETARDFPGHVLLADADAVIGFNSTAVFEAIAAGLPVVVPSVTDDVDPMLRAYTYDLSGAAASAGAESAIVAALEAACQAGRTVDLDARRRDVLDTHLGNGDGRAGDRLRAWLDRGMGTAS